MDTNKSIKLPFQVETKRIIEILSTEIYDSPLALLRENLQNAYDAVLMRKINSDEDYMPCIKLTINGKKLQIEDNGIGMNLETLRNNFWKAGSSGKRNNDLAQKAGVIGTFGIGAMANFGVCEILEILTTSEDSKFTYHSKAIRENLKIGEDCIDTEELPNNGHLGTTITATLDDKKIIDVTTCIKYLHPYIEYLRIPVYINNNIYSQNDSDRSYNENIKNAAFNFALKNISFSGFSYDLEGYALSNSIIYVRIKNISYQNRKEIGSMVLNQASPNIMTYRNFFGLSPIPVSESYNFGGFVNLSFLSPTAGREALSRESISLLTNLLSSIEYQVTVALSESETSNTNISFQRYIVKKSLTSLGKNVTIRVSPESKELKLSEIGNYNKLKTKSFYTGSNATSIELFANENNDLFLPSPSNPRRQIQLYFLNQKNVRQQGDDVQIIKEYKKEELSISEGTILFKITNVIIDDYLIKDAIVLFADISHGVTTLVVKEPDYLKIYIAKNSPSILQLSHYYEIDYSVLNGFIKDYVRMHLYQKFSQYVPSATKQGADALHKLLLKNRELFKIEEEDQGELKTIIADYLQGEIDFSQVVKLTSAISRSFTQTLVANQIGYLEEAIPDLIQEDLPAEQKMVNHKDVNLEAMPPLLREDSSTPLKLLHAKESLPQLNNFKLFIAVSDRLFKRDKDFFYEPHTTKIIWGTHKVVFIFGHVSNKITLYYDIELKDKIDEKNIGGGHFATTTIITKDKIFIPIPDMLKESFLLDKNNTTREFFIRYDIITTVD